MANISKITLPNGDEYNIKDTVARDLANKDNTRVFYGNCTTASTTQTKAVSIAQCTSLVGGDIFAIKFTNDQGYNGTPTLQINDIEAKAIRRTSGEDAGLHAWVAGEIVLFVWDGTCFLILNGGYKSVSLVNTTLKIE